MAEFNLPAEVASHIRLLRTKFVFHLACTSYTLTTVPFLRSPRLLASLSRPPPGRSAHGTLTLIRPSSFVVVVVVVVVVLPARSRQNAIINRGNDQLAERRLIAIPSGARRSICSYTRKRPCTPTNSLGFVFCFQLDEQTPGRSCSRDKVDFSFLW